MADNDDTDLGYTDKQDPIPDRDEHGNFIKGSEEARELGHEGGQSGGGTG